jgi:hypothetical protein
MRKIFLSAIIGLILSLNFVSSAKATEQKYKEETGFDYKYIEAYDLRNTNGNDRLYKETLANIERSSQPTIHYDTTVSSHYMCDWKYDKVLGRWVCGKDYMKAYEYTHPQPIQACSFGYKLNYGRTGCVKINVPTNAHLNSLGNGWECNPGFHTSYTGSSCLSDKSYVYTQCPGGSGSCDSGCQTSVNKSSSGYVYAYGSSTTKYQQPILQAETIIVTPVVYIINGSGSATDIIIEGNNGQNNLNPPTNVPLAKTGSDLYIAFLIGFISLSIVVVIRKFAKR